MMPGMNPKQMKQMERQMKKMGMKMDSLDGAREVIIRFDDKQLVIPRSRCNTHECNGTRNLPNHRGST